MLRLVVKMRMPGLAAPWLHELLQLIAVLCEDTDSRRVVRAVRQVQGAELGHQVHKAASHTLLVLRELCNIFQGLVQGLLKCTDFLHISQQ